MDVDSLCIASDDGAPLLAMQRRPHVGKSSEGRVVAEDRWSPDCTTTRAAHPLVDIFPSHCVKRCTTSWRGMAAEFVQSNTRDRIEFRFRAPVHSLIVREQGMRREGKISVQGLPQSTLRNPARKLTFVPADHEYCEWKEPSTLTSVIYFYLQPATLQAHSGDDTSNLSLTLRLLFEDITLWETALKLKRSVENAAPESGLYNLRGRLSFRRAAIFSQPGSLACATGAATTECFCRFIHAAGGTNLHDILVVPACRASLPEFFPVAYRSQ
jgi:AraC family transcriptional regulator